MPRELPTQLVAALRDFSAVACRWRYGVRNHVVIIELRSVRLSAGMYASFARAARTRCTARYKKCGR